MKSGDLCIDEAVRSEELLVPDNKLTIDSVVIGDKFSICDTCEVKVGVNASKSLLNLVEKRVDASNVNV